MLAKLQKSAYRLLVVCRYQCSSIEIKMTENERIRTIVKNIQIKGIIFVN